uniref:Replication restart protein PriA n=1 Tax=Candidatus Kentrum eta TaxID=2126337 RepID=A0A450V204_9GAMM|nr:MAG: replication restart DNA helicase PriA [Candidatus Kentron sp. H]VFJ92180.1 MAG: replication restart DNA helicase PriA [Candidatus Kentron sp. H]VFJ98850.1 MAG: replication restart DNA helicase PriA [Candidatus Kentron sp. H]
MSDEPPSPGPILRVAIPSPLRRLFDYLPPEDLGDDASSLPATGTSADNPQHPTGSTGENERRIAPGMRVRVPFGRTRHIGLILEVTNTSEVPPERLKPALAVLDREPLLPPDALALLRWASDYYHHPIGEVILGSLPTLLRKGRPAQTPGPRGWRLTPTGREHTGEALARAPRQAELLDLLHTHPDGIPEQKLGSTHGNCLPALRALEKRGWVEPFTVPGSARAKTPPPIAAPQPEPAQQSAIEAVLAARDGFQPFLLDGVTSSGKTEVYLAIIEAVISRGGQALVLIPEIGLTPQTVARFEQRIPAPVVALHSGLTDLERLRGWLAARNGETSVVIGTRSAAFVPLNRPGVFIVDEEHDLSYKQQDHFRYSARDVAVYRARQAGVPVVLGSATPSLETLHNAALGRYRRVTLPERAQGAAHPLYSVTDVRGKPFRNGLSEALIEAIGERLARREQVLLFLNRRGYAPIQLCHRCGWVANCERCDARMVYHVDEGSVSRRMPVSASREPHRQNPTPNDAVRDSGLTSILPDSHNEGDAPPVAKGRLCCHHCGAERPAPTRCPQCDGEELRPLWAGTQRIAQAIAEHFPEARIVRVDRDAIGPKGTLEKILTDVASGAIDILVGTQMLAKGHHFPNVTLVGIIDADGGLFGVDFRAGERMAQTIIQVAGRAGRGERPGQVLIQTHHPEHPLLQALVRYGYHRFAETALAERNEAALPPFRHLALARAESADREAGAAFLAEARSLAEPLIQGDAMTLFGPVPAPMERREGRYRAQLLFEARERGALRRLLFCWIPQVTGLKSAKRVRWSLDVDPQEMV